MKTTKENLYHNSVYLPVLCSAVGITCFVKKKNNNNKISVQGFFHNNFLTCFVCDENPFSTRKKKDTARLIESSLGERIRIKDEI